MKNKPTFEGRIAAEVARLSTMPQWWSFERFLERRFREYQQCGFNTATAGLMIRFAGLEYFNR